MICIHGLLNHDLLLKKSTYDEKESLVTIREWKQTYDEGYIFAYMYIFIKL
jgi:hypothetical protein